MEYEIKRNIWIGVGTGSLFLAAILLCLELFQTQHIEKPEKRISFVAAFTTESYWAMACGGAMEEGEKYNFDVKGLSSVEMSAEKLIANLESAIYSDVDGIITYGMRGSEEFVQTLEKADAQGIPVVLIDSDVDTEHKLGYVGSNNYLSGQRAGNEMAKDCGGKGKILVVVSYLETANQIDRVAGFRDALEQYPDMEIVEILEGESNVTMGQEVIMNALLEKPEINGIFCAEGVSACSAGYVMEKLEKDCEDIHVYAYDYSGPINEWLEQGYMSGTIQQDPKGMGKLAVRMLEEYMRTGTLAEKEIYTDTALITKENLEDSKNIDYGSMDIQWHYY